MTKKNKGGRPEAIIDFELVDKLCSIQCTGEEIAQVIGVNYDTLCERIKKKFKKSFPEYFKQKSGEGKAALRRKQFEIALKGNVVMMIWLGKQYLGQVDKSEVDANVEHLLPASYAEFIQLVSGRLKQLEEKDMKKIADNKSKRLEDGNGDDREENN